MQSAGGDQSVVRIITQPPLLYHKINGIRFYSCQRRLYFQVSTERHCQSYPSNTRDGHMQVGDTKNNYIRCNKTREYVSIRNARHQN